MERRLAAIFAADVVGYSRLMEADEEGTLAHLKALRENLIDPRITLHNGRIVKLMGDGALVEFASVVDAVRCGMEIQAAVAEHNAQVQHSERFELRIGINLGDVIVDGDDIYGDGVNVAARIEEMADPGGICISGSAFDQIKQKVETGFEFLGEQQVKNLAEPVRVYKLVDAPGVPGRVTRKSRAHKLYQRVGILAAAVIVVAAGGYAVWPLLNATKQETVDFCKKKDELQLPDRPSIAVLPFENLGTEPDEMRLDDIVTESIITTLAKVPDLFVIARNSTATYKGKPIKIKDVAQEFGVRYVIEGSVQRDADRMRITVQLIDSRTGRHIWVERYDRKAETSFAVVDEISFKIMNALEVSLTKGEQARIRGRAAENLEAYQYFLQAMEQQLRLSPDSNANAIQLAKKSIELDPKFWGGWIALGYAASSRYWYGSADKDESLGLGAKYAEKALEVGGKSNPDAYLLMSFVENYRGNHQTSIELAQKAIDLSPNMADAWGQLGITLNSAGRPSEAIPVIEKAMRLSPYAATYILFQLAKAYRFTGLHEKAIVANKRLICRSPQTTYAHRDIALSYGALGMEKEAGDAVAELLKIQPGYSLRDYIKKGDSGVDAKTRKRNVEILRRAGLPD